MDQENEDINQVSSPPDEISKHHSDGEEDTTMNSDPKYANDTDKPEEPRPDVYGGGDYVLEGGQSNGAGDDVIESVRTDSGGDGGTMELEDKEKDNIVSKDGSGDAGMVTEENTKQDKTDPDAEKDEASIDEEGKIASPAPNDEEEKSEPVDGEFSNPETLDSNGRSKLFERGKQFEQKGKKEHALSCYLGCLAGLSQSNQFPMLPTCLHQIADIYFEKEEFEKAVQFIQAEKLYYETALVDVTELKQKLDKERRSKSANDDKTDNDKDDVAKEMREDVLKAVEFENLAKLCLEQGNTQLALEYCGKATKILQAVYGEDHPKTIQSLDLFTVIYAEVGKKQYADAMKKFGIDENKSGDSPQQGQSSSSSEKETTVRFRGKEKPQKEKKEKEEETSSGLVDSEPQIEYEPVDPEQQDDYVMTMLMMLVFFLVTVLLALLITYLYCSYTQSSSCATVKSELTYYYMRLKYHYYYYFKSNQGNTYM